MIHIATVHWKTDKWIDIQLEYLKRNIQSDFKVYAFLNDVPGEHSYKFHYCSTEPIEEHAIKLNLLAERISWNAKNDDIIIFLDGDAFPISEKVVPFIHSKIGFHKLIAVQRIECHGDKNPHPCFCATTISFWNQIKGDWKMGHSWKDSKGLIITDVGGNLLLKLKEFEVNWLPLHRSNKNNLHPLWFGMYADMIYHHGAGFRKPFSRVDRAEGGFFINFLFRLSWFLKTLAAIVDKKFDKASEPLMKKNVEIDKLLFQEVKENYFFYENLL